MNILVLGHKEEGHGILVQIDSEKMKKRILAIAQKNRAKAILEILAKGSILRTVKAEEFSSLCDADLIIRESGTCWDLM